MVLQAADAPPAATLVVKALESVPEFRNVQVSGEGGRLQVELQVDAQGASQNSAAAQTGPKT
jgi:hypothetical protein